MKIEKITDTNKDKITVEIEDSTVFDLLRDNKGRGLRIKNLVNILDSIDG